MVNANAVMVNAQTDVRVEGAGIMVSYAEVRATVDAVVDAGSPVVRVRGIALMGSLDVRRKGPPGGLRKKMLRH